MMTVRPSEERGHADHGWLDSRHTFSFASYFDPAHRGFRSLRVINEDRVRAGAGFGSHPHRDMEILSFVLSGSLAHADSMGNAFVLGAGDVQRMSAGTGIVHSEKNPSLSEPVHFLQVWIEPERDGLEPSYEEIHLAEADKRGRLAPVATRDGGDGVLRLHQDAAVFASLLGPGEAVEHSLATGRHAWLHVVKGSLIANGERLSAGDGAAFSEERHLRLEHAGGGDAELLLFDLS